MPNSVLQNSVVVFSCNYLPIAKVNLRRAIILLVTGRAELFDLEPQRWQVRSPSLVLEISGHIQLAVAHIERAWKLPPVNRYEVLYRDDYRCQYCGIKGFLSLDLVLPRSRGGPHPAIVFAKQFWKACQPPLSNSKLQEANSPC
ncbi:MAG: HNH endonuclease [Cyanobacteria bacterium J06641_5]